MRGVSTRACDLRDADGALTILTGMTTAMHNLAVRTHCTCIVTPKIEILYLSFSARASTHTALLEPSRAHTYTYGF